MQLFSDHLVSLVVFIPLVWALLGLVIPAGGRDGEQDNGKFIRWWTLAGSLLVFVLSLMLIKRYQPDATRADFQMVEQIPWLPEFGISYFVGVDGLSLWLLILTSFLTPIVILGSFTAVKEKQKEFYTLILALETGMLGAFVALDVFLFYVFWEVMLIPMYFLIGVWGGKQRIYAAMKFFLYTVVGSLLMMVAILYLAYQHYLQFGEYSTAILDLYRLQINGDGWLSPQGLLFMAFAIAFAIKVPLFPLHTWLPDAHVQAPTAGSVILAGVLLKLGGYGFLRFAFPMFPEAVATYQLPFMILGAIAIVYGAWVALVQPDIKKLVAYSSVSHMGYVIIGLFSLNSIGVTGSIYQMLNHGISTGALFLLVGMIYERRHTREISEFGGLTKVMPLFAVTFLIVTLSAIALPGTNGFIGEFLILLGTWKSNPLIAAIAGLGVIFGAVYMLVMFQKVMFGKVTNEKNKDLKDLNFRELVVMAPLIIAIFVMGIAPNLFFGKMEKSVDRFLERSVTIQSSDNSETAYTRLIDQ